MFMFDQWARKITAGDVLGREVYHPLNGWQLATAPLEKWQQWYGAKPTFYKAPFYPYLVAGLYWAFGDTLLPLIALQTAASCLSLVLLFVVTERLMGRAPAFVAALLFAIYGPDVHYGVLMLRGPWIVLVSLLATWQLIELHSAPTSRRALGLGLTAGACLLVNEGFLTMVPLLVVVLPLKQRGLRGGVAILGAFTLGLGAALAPVILRNVLVGAPPFQLAVTGSTVYAVFNASGTNPFFFEARQGSFIPILLESGGKLTKTAWACLRSFQGPGAFLAFYLKKATGLAIPFENPDNANFYYACLRDPLLAALPGHSVVFPLGLIGLGVAARRNSAWPLLPAGLSLVASCLIALPLSRYRATAVVYLLPFAGLAVTSVVAWSKQRAVARLAIVAALGSVVILASRRWQAEVVFAGAPEGIFLYRPPEFLLAAQVQGARGHSGTALREISDLLRLNPDPSIRPTALLVAAGLQVRSGDRAEARATLRALARLRGDDPMILTTIGDFFRDSLLDPATAEGLYSEALSLHPPPEIESALRGRLAASRAAKPNP